MKCLLIGRILVPDLDIPAGIAKTLSEYLIATGESVLDVAKEGPRSEKTSLDREWLRLYAALQRVHENPENGLAVIDLAWALADSRMTEAAVQVLQSLEQAGSPGCWPDLFDEVPANVIGWILADSGDADGAISAYRRGIANPETKDKWPAWAQLGSVYQEIGHLEDAQFCYEQAIASINELSGDDRENADGYAPLLKELARSAAEGVPRRVIRHVMGVGRYEDYVT